MATVIRDVEEIYTVRGEKFVVTAPAKFDVETGEQLFDEQLDDQAVNLAFDQYRNEHDVVSPVQIVALRKKLGLSQRGFATLLGWSPTTVATYETGALPSKAKNQTLKSLMQNHYLAMEMFATNKQSMTKTDRDAFIKGQKKDQAERAQILIQSGISEHFKSTDYTANSGNIQFSLKKFTQMVLFFTNKCKEISRTKLNKLLFYADFSNFKKQTVSISGVSYARLPYGPVPNDYSLLYGAMETAGAISTEETESGGRVYECYVPNEEFDESFFSSDELETLNEVLKKFGKYSAKRISDVSHNEKAWKENGNGQLISYYDADELIGM